MKKYLFVVIFLTLPSTTLLAQDAKRVIVDETSKWVMYGPYVKQKKEFYENIRLYFSKRFFRDSKNEKREFYIKVDSTGKILPVVSIGLFNESEPDDSDTLLNYMNNYIRLLHPQIEPAYLRFKQTNNIEFIKSVMMLYLKFRRGKICKVSHEVFALKPKRRSIHSGE